MPRDVTCGKDWTEALFFPTVYVGLLVKYVLLQCIKYERIQGNPAFRLHRAPKRSSNENILARLKCLNEVRRRLLTQENYSKIPC